MISTLNAVCGSTTQNSQTEPIDAVFDGKILAHHAKAGYDYPTIRLPFTFSGLIGRSTRMFQTDCNGALAFLVVLSTESSPKSEETPFQSRKPSPLHGEGRRFEFGRAHRLFSQSGSIIKPEAADDELVLEQLSFQEWLKYTDLRLIHGGARIVNGDLRKFCEQRLHTARE
jgi:hypothetical protein